MPHEYAGKYGSKHPAGTIGDPAIAQLLEQRAKDGRITCTAAHEIAATVGVFPSEVGKAADLVECRLIECQMGLFGYSPEKRLVKPAEVVEPDLRDLLDRLTTDGRITCASCWRIAETLGISKMSVSAACEYLGLKIKPCQLGAF